MGDGPWQEAAISAIKLREERSCSAFSAVVPPHLRVRHGIGRGEIRLDVDERRVVEAVETDDREPVAVDAEKPRHRGCDRVRPRWRAQREGAAALGIMARRLQHEIAPRLVHPIEQQHVADRFEAGQAFGPARIDFDGTNRVGFSRVLWAVFAPLPRRADAPDIIERGVEPVRQRDRDFALAERIPVAWRWRIARRSLGFGRLDHDRKVACGLASRQRPAANHPAGPNPIGLGRLPRFV